MHDILLKLGHGLLMAAGMLWQTGWSLVLGFTLSAVVQVLVPSEQVQRVFGRGRVRGVAAAVALGAASSSCSYASASMMRTMLGKGASLVTAMAFMFASTNLVIELGIILLVLMGWQFMVGEWLGGVVLVALMSLLVWLTYPEKLVRQACGRAEASTAGAGQRGGSRRQGWARLLEAGTRVKIAQTFGMELGMLWKDLAIGFGVAGMIAALVPAAWWNVLFLQNASPWVKAVGDAVLGPVLAMLTFVCSCGNVPLAAVLWGGGVSFGGVLAFLYGDLIVLPLLDVYRRYYGWKMAAYMFGVLFSTMVMAGLIMEGVFSLLGWIPDKHGDAQAQMTHFGLDYTFWLNVVFGALALYWWWLARRNPAAAGQHGECCHHHHH